MSRFVSAGTDEDPVQPPKDAWAVAKEQVEASRFVEPVKPGKQEDGRSLYEVLQANKAAKQEAFEESSRLKNQFRALDDGEIEFLDSVRQSELSKEAAVKRNTAEQLDLFRQQQAMANRAANSDAQSKTLDEQKSDTSTTSWTAKKKRRRNDAGDEDSSATKLKRHSTAQENTTTCVKTASESSKHASPTSLQDSHKNSAVVKEGTKLDRSTSSPVGLGLGLYNSDDDD